MDSHGFIQVHQGKLVRFKQGGQLVKGTENAKFLLEEDVTITMQSQFSPLIKSESPAFLSVLSQQWRATTGNEKVSGFLSGQWKQFGFQTWTSTQPLVTSITLTVSMNTNAKRDVFDPVMALAKLCLPSDGGSGNLIPPGPAILESLTEENANQPATDDEGSTLTAGRQLHCYLGNYILRNIIVTTAQPTFSKSIDNFGYPISASIQLTISTIFSATTQMVDDLTNYTEV